MTIKEGRIITYSNLFHTRFNSFKLADCTKPGHQKLLILYLVDPNVPIISTADVPCQRMDWWAETVMDSGENLALNNLPTELKSRVLDQVDDFPIDMKSAKVCATHMLQEYRVFHDETQTAFEEWRVMYHDD